MIGFTLAATGGFILLHASQCQPKNTTSVVVANLLSIAVATISFWGVGFAFALGENSTKNSNFFLSHSRFFLYEATAQDYVNFGNEVVVLGLVIVLANGGFIARLRHWVYPLVSIFVAGFIYPCTRHWTGHIDGWLKDGITVDKIKIVYTDMYGAASIHVFGGSAALLGTILLAPRRDREAKGFKPVGGNLIPLILAGGSLALVGLIVKNGGMTNGIALTNNILAAQAGALTAYLLKRTGYCGDPSSTKALLNGAIAGVVGVACMPERYHAYGAFVVGLVAALAYVGWSALLQLCHVDDPTDTVAVHLGAGLWAVLAGPIFDKTNGCLYDGAKENFQKFGWHVLGGVAVFVWTGLTVFIVMVMFVWTRIAKYSNQEAVQRGLDAYEHEPAYPDREQYTQDQYDQGVDDLLPSRDNKGYSNGYDNPHRGVSRHSQQPISLDYRNEQQWKNSKY